MENFEILDGMLWVNPQETDFLMGDNVTIPDLPEQDQQIVEYNQYVRQHTKMCCTMYWPIWAISDLFNYQFTDQEIDGVIELAKTRGYVVWQWRRTQSGVKTACDWRNANKEQKVVYFRLNLLDKKVLEALAKSYTIVVSYRGNQEYNLDYMKDNVLNCKELKTRKSYGHCTSLRYNKDRNISVIKDSAKGSKYNIYDILYLSDLIKNNVYEPTAYMIIPEELTKAKSKEEIKRLSEMLVIINTLIENNSKLWKLTNDDILKTMLNKQNYYLRDRKAYIKNQI